MKLENKDKQYAVRHTNLGDKSKCKKDRKDQHTVRVVVTSWGGWETTLGFM